VGPLAQEYLRDIEEGEGDKVIKLKGPCGDIFIHPPDRPPTKEEEDRLYWVLLECLTETKKKE